MIVVDASVLASALGDDGADGQRARHRLASERLFAPEIVDLEVGSVWRRAVRARRLDPRRALQALADLPLMARVWELRDNLTPYDAAYVALAEAIPAPLVTADQRLAAAPGIGCEIALLR